MLKSFFVQEHFWTVWFLACLFLVEIIYYILNRFLSRYRFVVTIASALLCILGLVRYRIGLGSLPWNLDIALVAQFFFHLGFCFKKSKNLREKLLTLQDKKIWIVSACFLLINILSAVLCIKIARESLDMSVGLYGNELLTFIAACSGITFIVMISNQLHSKFFTYLGQNTMIIFSWHSRIIIVLCGYIYRYLGILQGNDILSQLVYTTITLIIILLLLIPINELIKRSKIHKLFGV